jgi:cytochrome c556
MKLRVVMLASALCAWVAAADTAMKSDSRIVMTVDAHAKTELLAEMRAHLVNVQKLLEALSHNDLQGVARAARASGVASATETADELIGRLPQGFVALGLSMHRDFDRIADRAAQGESADRLLATTAAVLQKCVACHTTYQLRIGQADPVRRSEH